MAMYGYYGPAYAYYGPGYYPWYHGYWRGGYYGIMATTAMVDTTVATIINRFASYPAADDGYLTFVARFDPRGKKEKSGLD